MSSSDSGDDYYGNIAQKLQSLKKQYAKENVDCKTSEDVQINEILSDAGSNTCPIAIDDFDTTINSTDNDELTLDAIIAMNTTPKRGRKRKSADKSFEPIYEFERRSTRRKTANSNKAIITECNESPAEESSSGSVPRGSKRRGRSRKTATNTSPKDKERSGGSSRGRGRGSTPSRGRGRGRNRHNNVTTHVSYPTFSIGNTDEYPDMCDNQELFSAKPTKSNDVETVDDEDPLDNDNEELSVKVFWQNVEVVRFNIRKYQMLSPIFKYFSQRENVSPEKLLFMYNDKIITVDDTPDTINYSIAKFIDGGIVEQNFTSLTKQNSQELKDGLVIKFQCQHLKKPFETTVRPEDKLALAMMKCAEQLEIPIDRLKFYFDGDLISSKNTPQDLELEGGECIDVKTVS